MKRGGPLQRKTRMRARNPKRGHKFPHLVDGPYREWIRSLTCEAVESGGCNGTVQAAHVRTRGAGGADRGNLVPLCAKHHGLQHDMGIKSFQAAYGLDMKAIAAKLALAYDKEEPPVW